MFDNRKYIYGFNSSLLLIWLLMISCYNPFLPQTGMPVQAVTPRATPSGVIDQLIESYENKRLDLYEDLFPKSKTFQFYVAPTFMSIYASEYDFPPEPRDTLLHNIGESPVYYYWTQDYEIRSHKNLFANADRIEFATKPWETIRYIIENGDTAKAEVQMNGGELVVYVKIKESLFLPYYVNLDKQDFLMEKDDQGLWVIRKWYDLSNAPSE